MKAQQRRKLTPNATQFAAPTSVERRIFYDGLTTYLIDTLRNTMRFFTLLLIFLNLAFFSWSQGYLTPARQDSQRLAQQIEPDAIHLVAHDEPPRQAAVPEPALASASAPTSAPIPKLPSEANQAPSASASLPTGSPTNLPTNSPAKPPEAPSSSSNTPAPKTAPQPQPTPRRAEDESCLYYAGLPASRVTQLEAMLTRQFPSAKAVRIPTESNANYWVHIPPLTNRSLADKKVAELVKFGVHDYFIVHESGANNLAISLGLFSTKEGAETLLANLRSKGIRSAKISERRDRQSMLGWQVYAAKADAAALTEALSHELSGIKPATCKRPENK